MTEWLSDACGRCGNTRWGFDLVRHSDWRRNERCLSCNLVRRKATLEGHQRWQCDCGQRTMLEELSGIPDATTVCDVCGRTGQFHPATTLFG